MKTGEEAVGILLDALNRLNVDYMVVGSFSSNRYGVPRATQDADILVSLVAADRDRLFTALPKEFQIEPMMEKPRMDTDVHGWKSRDQVSSISVFIRSSVVKIGLALGKRRHGKALSRWGFSLG